MAKKTRKDGLRAPATTRHAGTLYVTLDHENSVLAPGLTAGTRYLLLREYWFNEEGWCRVLDETTGKIHTVPDVLFK